MAETPLTDEVKVIFNKLGKKGMEKIAREAFQAAAKDFLTEVFAKFGRWSFYGIMASFLVLILGILAFGYAYAHGWRPQP